MDSAIFDIFKQYTIRYAELTESDFEKIEPLCIYREITQATISAPGRGNIRRVCMLS